MASTPTKTWGKLATPGLFCINNVKRTPTPTPTPTPNLTSPKLQRPYPILGQQKTRSADRAGFGSASREAYLRRNFVLNFSTRPAESTKRFSPV